MSQQIGLIAEMRAQKYLVGEGLHFLTNNYHCRWGEIDLIMMDKATLVFVEVRSRVSEGYGGALGSITAQKQKKIIKTASHYMAVKKLHNTHSARFDVLCIQGVSSEIQWVKDAFRVDY